MAGKRVLVLGRFVGGVRQRDIRKALRAAGHTVTGSVRRAEVVIAGSRCGVRLAQARQAGLSILDQTTMTRLTQPAEPAAPAKPSPPPAAAPAAAPAARPRKPRRAAPARPSASPQDSIRQLAHAPQEENSWWQIGQLLEKLPPDTIAGVVSEIADPISRWPAHSRGAHTAWLASLAEGKVEPRLKLVGQLYLTDVIKKHGLEAAARVLDLRAEHMPGVRQLRINHFKGDTDWVKILTPARTAGLTGFDFMYDDLGVKRLEKILAVLPRDTVEVLDLRSNSLGWKGMKVLADAGLTALRWLHLYSNSIKTKGLRHLTGCADLSGLTFLSVASNQLSSAAGSALAKATFAENLTWLKVKYNNLFAQGAKALAKAKSLSNLVHLDFSANEIGDAGLEALAHSESLPALQTLQLEGNAVAPLIGDEGLWALADGAGMPKLEALNLQGNNVTASGLEGLLRSPRRTALHTLDLVNNNVPADGAEILMAADLPVKLRSLSISFDDGKQPAFVRLLKGASAFSSLEKLVIRPPYSVQKKAAVTEALMSNPHLRNLRELEVRDFSFSDKALDALITREFPHLRVLNLSSPGFTDARLQTFTTADWLPQLRKLVLYEYPKKPDYTALKAMFEGSPTVCVAF